ncbi:hypothetical protein D3C75_1338330 [compost metagenome]
MIPLEGAIKVVSLGVTDTALENGSTATRPVIYLPPFGLLVVVLLIVEVTYSFPFVQ